MVKEAAGHVCSAAKEAVLFVKEWVADAGRRASIMAVSGEPAAPSPWAWAPRGDANVNFKRSAKKIVDKIEAEGKKPDWSAVDFQASQWLYAAGWDVPEIAGAVSAHAERKRDPESYGKITAERAAKSAWAIEKRAELEAKAMAKLQPEIHVSAAAEPHSARVICWYCGMEKACGCGM